MTAREELAERLAAWIQCTIWGHDWRQSYKTGPAVYGIYMKKEFMRCVRCNKEKP